MTQKTSKARAKTAKPKARGKVSVKSRRLADGRSVVSMRSTGDVDLRDVVGAPEEHADLMSLSVAELKLGTRALSALAGAGLVSLGDLCRLTREELEAVRGMGSARVGEVEAVLRDLDLELASEPGKVVDRALGAPGRWQLWTFGRVLRSLREGSGRSMGDLARHLRVSVTRVSDLERDRVSPLAPGQVEDVIRFLRLAPEGASRLRGVLPFFVPDPPAEPDVEHAECDFCGDPVPCAVSELGHQRFEGDRTPARICKGCATWALAQLERAGDPAVVPQGTDEPCGCTCASTPIYPACRLCRGTGKTPEVLGSATSPPGAVPHAVVPAPRPESERQNPEGACAAPSGGDALSDADELAALKRQG